MNYLMLIFEYRIKLECDEHRLLPSTHTQYAPTHKLTYIHAYIYINVILILITLP